MNGTEIDQFVQNFTVNWWPNFVEFWVVVISMAVIPAIILILNWYRKPKIILQSTITSKEIKKNENVYYRSIDFWVNVSNIGKRHAKNCHAFLTLMDEDFKENILWRSSLPQYSTSDPFSVYWYFLDSKTTIVDIPVSNKSGYAIKIPFHYEMLEASDENWPFGNIWKWDTPVESINESTVEITNQPDIFNLAFGVVLEITYDENKTIRKKFVLKIPYNKKTNSNVNNLGITFREIDN